MGSCVFHLFDQLLEVGDEDPMDPIGHYNFGSSPELLFRPCNATSLDEEPPEKIFQECMQRGRKVDGRILLTFTPLSGYTKVVETFLSWERLNNAGGSLIAFALYCTPVTSFLRQRLH